MEVSLPVSRQSTPPSRPADPLLAKPEGGTGTTEPDLVYPKVQRIETRTVVSGPVSRKQTPPSHPADPPLAKPEGDIGITEPDLVYPKVQRIETRTVVSGPVSREQNPPSRPADPSLAKPEVDTGITEPDLVYPKVQRIETRTEVSGPESREPTVPFCPEDIPVVKPVDNKKIPAPVAVPPRVHTLYKRAVIPQPADSDDTDIAILSQIREIDGIVAISVFNNSRIIITVGDTDSDALLKIARTMLETAKKVTPRPSWGPFVHMTIELPAGNMIIAPYHDNYLCLLTTRTINIGHIRRILRDLQRKSAPQCVI
jgi:predicted regulator of Ras-like GTPase activity (Roadblock/LC7/MglB family)